MFVSFFYVYHQQDPATTLLFVPAEKIWPYRHSSMFNWVGIKSLLAFSVTVWSGTAT